MATLAVYSSSSLRQAVRVPFSVKVLNGKHTYADMKAWIKNPLNRGKYRFDEGQFRWVFYFSDENTAFAFKMRFG